MLVDTINIIIVFGVFIAGSVWMLERRLRSLEVHIARINEAAARVALDRVMRDADPPTDPGAKPVQTAVG